MRDISTVVVDCGAAGRGVHRGRAGVGKQVEEALAACGLSQAGARYPVIEEQPGVEVVVEVDAEFQAAFDDVVEVGLLVDFLVLLAALVAAAGADVDALFGDAGDLWHH